MMRWQSDIPERPASLHESPRLEHFGASWQIAVPREVESSDANSREAIAATRTTSGTCQQG